MQESLLLSHIYARSGGLPAPIAVGPGDDCAVLDVSRANAAALLVTVDQLVEGRHYVPEASLDLVARKAVARSVSDIAAMAGRPLCGFATGALRAGFEGGNALFDAMARWARRWECPLAGGDIAEVDGPTVLTVTVIGEAHALRGPVLRSGARPGDTVYVTGRLGGSLGSGRHMTFEPRVAEGAWLAETLGERLHAMLDVSDGLGRDGGRLADASRVRVELRADRLPRHDDVPEWTSAAADGEDYELVFAASGPVPDACPLTGTPITAVGEVREGRGCVIVTPGGETIDASELGWDHGRGAAT